ncbi:MAG TPA: trypsin-like peptidase domain-containing protein [Casimicrobiaceae bacterium]|nr:trypsin-like peptidase domain-containing protein [Casimicrobiaceae bacterium]
MLRRLWLLFAQACTLCLAALFVVATLRPELLGRSAARETGVVLRQETSTPVVTPTVASHADAARKAMPAVVNIYTSKEVRQRNPLADDAMMRRYFPDLAERGALQRVTSLGSGVIVAPDGFVLTNYHVIQGADDIQLVLNDGRRMAARVRGIDPESDLAVLKADQAGLPAITFGAIDRVQVGDTVLAIGNPFGLGNTVTSGIVSALGRNHLGINSFEDFIQTDAAINLGNSGGALVDAAGNLIGINSMIYSQSGGSMGIGFAIPVSIARNVLEQIIRDGEVTRGWLGVGTLDLPPDVAQSMSVEGGVVVREVVRGGPADRAGIHAKDVVVEIDGKPTRDTPALLARIAELPPGSIVKVRIWRDNAAQDLDVTVGKRPPRP